MKFHTLFVLIPTLVLTSGLVSGESLTVELTGVSVNDGQFYVLPYQLTIDGTPTNAICYDALDEISMNQVWQANLYDLDQAANQGEFSYFTDATARYETVAYLASYWYTGLIAPGDTADEIALQYAIWDVFDPGAFTVSSSFVENLLDADGLAPESALAAFSEYSDYSFLEAIPEDNGYQAQAFVLYTPPGGGGQENPAVPEPDTRILAGIGVVLIGVSKARAAVLRRHSARVR